MGKSKTRILRKGINDQLPTMTREEAIDKVVDFLNKRDVKKAKELISIFGLIAEEILESGASYESVVAIKSIFK